MTADVRTITGYEELLTTVVPRPPRTQEDVDALNDLIDTLTDLPNLSEGQLDFIGLIGRLVYDWESTHEEPISAPTENIVRMLLEDRGLRQQDLVGSVFPNRHAVSDFLAGRRPLTYDRVMKLAAFFGVSPALFYPSAAELRARHGAQNAPTPEIAVTGVGARSSGSFGSF
jgi:HTH-type transcriptional regulator/antitoxin HigA